MPIDRTAPVRFSSAWVRLGERAALCIVDLVASADACYDTIQPDENSPLVWAGEEMGSDGGWGMRVAGEQLKVKRRKLKSG